MVQNLGEMALGENKTNIAFLSFLLRGDLDKCLEILIDTNRLPEAAFFARSYLPSKISYVVEKWREQLTAVNEKAGQSIADPQSYPNLFPGLSELFKVEQFLQTERKNLPPASLAATIKPNSERNVLEELKSYESGGHIINDNSDILSSNHLETTGNQYADLLGDDSINQKLSSIKITDLLTPTGESSVLPKKSSTNDLLDDLELESFNIDENIDTSVSQIFY